MLSTINHTKQPLIHFIQKFAVINCQVKLYYHKNTSLWSFLDPNRKSEIF